MSMNGMSLLLTHSHRLQSFTTITTFIKVNLNIKSYVHFEMDPKSPVPFHLPVQACLHMHTPKV